MAVEQSVTILNTWGLHVRPATLMAQTASRYTCQVQVVKDGRAGDAKSPIALLTLGAVTGTELTLRAEGEDAQAAVASLAALVGRRFDMDQAAE